MKKKNKKANNQNSILIMAAAIIIVLVVVFYMMTGTKGEYKEGTYFASSNTATAVVYVNEKGFIKSVFIDTAYMEYKDGACAKTEVSYGVTKCVPTTKQSLNENYGMRAASPIGKEWYEQANAFADKVVDEQGTEWLVVKDDQTTDSVSGVTMHVSDIAIAVKKALLLASK